MIYINLLPVRQVRARLRARNEVAIYLASVFVLLIALSMVAIDRLSVSDKLKSENVVLIKKKASYQDTINEINKLKKDKKTQQTKLNVITELKKTSQVSVHVMDEIANLTPQNRLWLQSMKLSENKLDVAGIALDNATIAQFMDSISTSTYFTNSALTKSSQTEVAGAKLKSFSLKIDVSTPK